MNIEDNSIVRFHYTVSELDVGELESSRGREPLMVMIGHGSIIPGLETAMKGRTAGESFEVTVTPEQGYGERRDGLAQRVPRKHFKNAKLVPGMQVIVPTGMGERPVTVIKVGMSVVDIDLNHPMAGKTLRFEVEILDVREATDEEKAHGHAHGEGGHQH